MLRGMPPDSSIQALLAALDEAYDHKSWHGTNLRGSLRSVTVQQAVWRPAKGRHNIWELAVHAAYWKYIVRRSITAETRGSFSIKGSNWFIRDGTDSAQWRADLRMLADEHRATRAAVAALDPRRLGETGRRRFTLASLIRGVAAHDLYHAGQIQLLRRMQRP